MSAPERYIAQMRVKGIGQTGQARLQRARVTVVGAGGLGSAILPLLAGAGVGELTVWDPDLVSVTNLHRQTLYSMHDVGQAKAQAACVRLHACNPLITLKACPNAMTPANVQESVQAADVVVDAADQFAVSYLLSDACQVAQRPLISGSVVGVDGYAGTFCQRAPSYRAIFPRIPDEAPTSADIGVLGPVVAIIGSIMAQATLSLLLRPGDPTVMGRLWRWRGQPMTCGGFTFFQAPEVVATQQVGQMQTHSG